MRQLITIREGARRLGIHVSTLRRWVREGHVPAYRKGQRYVRVAWEDVLAALETQRRKKAGSRAAGEESDATAASGDAK